MTKQISKELLKKLIIKSQNKSTVSNDSVKTTKKKRTVRKRRKKNSSSKKKAGNYTSISLHPKVKALVAKITSKEPHGLNTLKKFSMEKFRLLLCKGCRKCKGSSLNKDGNYCDCVNEIAPNFIDWCKQYYAWYYANVDYMLPKGDDSEEDSQGSDESIEEASS